MTRFEKRQDFDTQIDTNSPEIQQFLAEEWTRIHQNDPQPEPNYDEISMAYERYDDAMVVANNA
ncbi:hypothetical protein EB001_03240 [bacterium]|nr:hypothetical protein [bacterium]